ncbi:hypothetical protein CMV_013062 [Castanea mollissima]|uniref:DNA-directed DNA polymerase family B exonuclease domain-containing protein n=1 Tax=Castanea mollissima TaxID=60419 RepID=A0A8J4VW41_9ROSI|nr:hypothetical protein CMV_013062 [Castanea mollissima]
MLVFSEKYLCSQFMKIVYSSDPDIILGWDIQGGSLGFLAERASHLGIGLLNNFDGSSGTVMDDLSPFFEGNCREVKEVVYSHARISGSDSD